MSVNNILNSIRIVLIQTSHPGNIGSTARAMKTMGFTELFLVSPKSFPDDQATAMSSNANDILDGATVVDSLQEAIADCELVIGSSARDKRSLAWDILTSRECGERVVKHIHSSDKSSDKGGKVALVFGRESSGLTNDELALCHFLVNVPSNPDYSSLNLASAVQILSYECRLAALGVVEVVEVDKAGKQEKLEKASEEIVTARDMENYYKYLETTMIESEFLDPENPKHLMTRLRRMFGRIRLTRSELNIMRGMLVSFRKKQ